MRTIQSNTYPVHFGAVGYEFINQHLKDKKYSKIGILTDTNTNPNCLPHFLSKIEGDYPFEIIEMEAGEEHKHIETCTQVWLAMADLSFDRKSLLINLGGGVVTDLGGFVASTYQRGIDFINIPTSLLSMVDASVGGKTGVDLGTLKNQVGVINNPLQVLIDVDFLKTLPSEELRSGMAEMFKHGLIQSPEYWEQMKNLSDLDSSELERLVFESVEIKNRIVLEDPTEKSIRKFLNYGHTLGHAIESYCLSSPQRERLLHGEAVAIGMILATYISSKLLKFSQEKTDEIKKVLLSYFSKVLFTEEEISEIINLMKFDKKNSHGAINFVLLRAIGEPELDCQVPNEMIFEAFNFYQQ